MLAIANNLFTEVALEESASVSGGVTSVNFDLNSYLFLVGVGTVFGPTGVTNDELLFAQKSAITLSTSTNTPVVTPPTTTVV